MTSPSSTRRNRVQIDLRPDQLDQLRLLEEQLGARSRAQVIEESIATLLWFLQERRQGRRVVSVNPEELPKLSHAVELVTSSIAATSPEEHYEYLEPRPHPWRHQLSLKGHNITVGQLVASMNADHKTPAEAAEDFDLPLAQIQEALAYYQTHQELVDSELREDRRWLQRKGYRVEPPPLS